MAPQRHGGKHPNRKIYGRVEDLVVSERLTDPSSDAIYRTSGDIGRHAEVLRLREEAEEKLGRTAIGKEDIATEQPGAEYDTW